MTKKLLSIPEYCKCSTDEEIENHGNTMMNAIYEISEEITTHGAMIIEHYTDIGHIDVVPYAYLASDSDDLNYIIECHDYKNGIDVYKVYDNCYQIAVHGSTYKLLSNGKLYSTEAVITVHINE